MTTATLNKWQEMVGPMGVEVRFVTPEPRDALEIHSMGYHAVVVPLDRAEEMAWAMAPELIHAKQLFVVNYGHEQYLRTLGTLKNAKVLQLPEGVRTVEELLRQKGDAGAKAYLAREMQFAEPYGQARAPLLYEPLEGDALLQLGRWAAAPISAVPTFLPAWNEACRGRGGRTGIAHGWHIVLGGIEGFGKTLIANNLADSALNAGEVVTFHSLEMEWNELALRQLTIGTAVDPSHLEPGAWFREHEFKRAVELWEGRLKETGGKLMVNRDDLRSLKDVIAGIRYHYEVHGSKVHIIDYLQLAWTKGRNKLDEIEEITHAVRGIGKELGVVTVGLSQFTREAKKERTESPHNDALMGGSPLENDASQIILLDHSRVRWYQDGSWDGWLLLSKNRHGPTLRPPKSPGIPIHFNAKTLRIRERLPDEIDDAETVEGRNTKNHGRKR